MDGGDNVNLAVGQGDLQATPLQLAVAYSAIANGGTVVTPAPRPGGRGRQRRADRGDPHAGRAARSSSTRATATAILDGLHGAATEQPAARRPTSSRAGRAYPVYGKTGTAEREPNPDQSWYACFVDGPDASRSWSS